jgi:hypothetical protein
VGVVAGCVCPKGDEGVELKLDPVGNENDEVAAPPNAGVVVEPANALGVPNADGCVALNADGCGVVPKFDRGGWVVPNPKPAVGVVVLPKA